jgi:hypothetical protein
MAKKQISNYKFTPGNVIPDTNLFPNAAYLLEVNKKFIQEETIAYIEYNSSNNISPYAYYTYNAEKCRRDVSYVLEGYLSDLKHGGNRQTVFNAQYYWLGGVPQVDGDRQPEVYAHNFIKNLIQNYILTNAAFTFRQTTFTQITDNAYVAETAGKTKLATLADIVINVIDIGLSVLPAVVSNRGAVKFPGFYKLKDILLITNTSRNIIYYNFADPSYKAEITYTETYDSDFAGALYGNDRITTITFDIDTSTHMVTDSIQIFVEAKEQTVRLNSIATDAMERQKVGIPQSMLDADFEYGLQPTKWQTISTMRNYPSVYEIPGSDKFVVSVTSDASATNTPTGTGSSTITVVTVAAHGFLVGDVFTIKALSSSVLGFGRAEGTFIVAAIPTVTSFTYYAKNKVGTVNPTLLSSSYTQLRAGGFYTGSSVGQPTFTVYSNGQSGTVTTSLAVPAGSAFVGYTGVSPLIGSPVSGSNITSGTQISGVTGTGGTVASVKLNATANIGDTSLIVTSTAGIVTGLVLDRGDGVAVQVTNIVQNTLTLSGALTSAIEGTTGTYTNIIPNSTNGAGAGATFNVSRIDTIYSVATGSSVGGGYVVGEVITISGTSLGGNQPGNNLDITVTGATGINSVATFDDATLEYGSGYSSGTGVATTSTGSGTGLTVNTVALGGGVQEITVDSTGSGYAIGDVITVQGGNLGAKITVLTVTSGGAITAISHVGTPVATGTVNFIGSVTLSEVTTGTVANGATLTYTSIATIEILFGTPHGFIPGDSITVTISSTGANSQLAAGAYYVEQVPTANSIRYTARAPGILANTLVGVVYSRPDSYYVHRPLDGGVQLGTGGPAHGAQAIRMSKKYIRYQSGKGIMYNTGALFAPSYDILSISSSGTTTGSVITISIDDVDHGCQIGAQVQINNVTTAGYNGVYVVSNIVNERVLRVVATTALGSTSGVLGSPCTMSIRGWHGATVRSGTFDDQNGMFWQYDGIQMSLVKRSSTFQIAGTINLGVNSNSISGTNTRFTQQLSAGDRIVIRGMSHVVSNVISDTSMSVTPDYRGVTSLVNAKICKTIDLIVSQNDWNLDTLNGSGQSGYTLDVTKMQMIGMQWTWYGAGFIDFMLRGSDGNYCFAHRFRNSNVNSEAYMRTGNMPVRYEVINEGAKDKLSVAINSTTTTLQLTNTTFFPTAGTVMIENEIIRYTNKSNTSLLNCVRGSSLTQFVAGSNKSFTAGPAATHDVNKGVILISNTITPIISHWGSAFMIDGQFDADRGYLFNYASTGVAASVDPVTSFLIRLAPSVSNAQTGDLGERELLNRAQLLLDAIAITSDNVSSEDPFVGNTWSSGGTATSGLYYSNTSAGVKNWYQATSTGSFNSTAPTFTSGTGASGTYGVNLTWAGATPNNAGGIVVQGVLNPINYPTDPTKISWNGLSASAAGGQPSFAQIAAGGSVTWGGGASTSSAVVAGKISTSITARSFAPVSVSLTAFSFNIITATVSAASFGNASNSLIALAFASNLASASVNNNVSITARGFSGTQPYGNTNYRYAVLSGRIDILITNVQYNTLQASAATAIGPGDNVQIAVGQLRIISSITPSYLGGIYTRIVFTATPSSTLGDQTTANLTAITGYRYVNATTAGRSDIVVSTATLSGLSPQPTVGNAVSGSGVPNGTTITAITTDFALNEPKSTSNGAYTRIVLSQALTVTSATGTNITIGVTTPWLPAYTQALSTSRNDFLVTTSSYDTAVAQTPWINGDTLSTATYLSGQTISSITRDYVTVNATAYTRIIMNAVATVSSPVAATNGAQNISTVVTSSVATLYNRALNSTRFDFLTTSTTGASVSDLLSVATYLTSGQTISSITPNYTTIAGVSYIRVLMSSAANASSTANSGNNIASILAASQASLTYGSAINSNRSDILVYDSDWTVSGLTVGDVLSNGSFLTGGQTILSVTVGFITLNSISCTRIVMSANANGTSTAMTGSNGNQFITVVVEAAGSADAYVNKNFLFFNNTVWLASGATVGTKINTTYTQFPAGTGVGALISRQLGNNVVSVLTNATSTSSGTRVTFALTGTQIYPVGSSVTVTGVTGVTAYNGTWLVSASSSGSLEVISTVTGTATWPNTNATVTTTVFQRVAFTQSANTTIAKDTAVEFKFGAQYALPGEQVFSFITNPGDTTTLSLAALKELTSTSIGGRGTFPNGPDVLAINVYKVSGSNTDTNILLRWGEAQA